MRSLAFLGLVAFSGAAALPAHAQMTARDFQPTPEGTALTFAKVKPVRKGPSRFGDLPLSGARSTDAAMAAARQASGLSGDSHEDDDTATGTTGFDAANISKKRKKKPRYAAPPPPPLDPAAAATARAIARGPQQLYSRRFVRYDPAAAATATPLVNYVPVHRIPRYEDDPYAPLGLRSGSFLWFPGIELSAGYDTNPLRRTARTPSDFFVVAPELKVQSQWLRHRLNAELRGSYTTYGRTFEDAAASAPPCDCTPGMLATQALTNSGIPRSLDRPDFNSKVTGRLDTYGNSHADGEFRFNVGTDNPGSPNITAGLDRLPIYTQVGTTLGYTQNFNRLDVTLKGGVDRVAYQQSHLTDGTSTSNNDRDLYQYSGALRVGYQLRPGVEPFAEVSADQRVHDLTYDRSGLRRDSTGTTLRAGSTFELTRQLVGEGSVGYTMRDYKDPSLKPLSGFVADAALVWTQSALTVWTLSAKSAADESILTDVSGALRRDVSLNVDQYFRRWLVGSLKAGAGFDHYIADGPSREDQRYFLSAALAYKLSRDYQIRGEIRRDWLNSSVAGVDYVADTYLLTLRWQR